MKKLLKKIKRNLTVLVYAEPTIRPLAIFWPSPMRWRWRKLGQPV
jgi:hypothetical protein